MSTERSVLVRRGLLLNYLTIAYNSVEAVAAIAAGLLSGSVVLIGFGLDSVIEVSASGAAQWRLRSDFNITRRDRAERISLRIIGGTFLALAAYVAYDSVDALMHQQEPDRSVFGVIVLVLSVVIMPVLARRKRTVANLLNSGALRADATQTSLCAYLSVIALIGVGLNAAFGLWWADPIAALLMVPIIAREGFEGIRGVDACVDECA
jgi:divalent metal cation (Fe/Co/Zn/Cd) transporter